MGCWEERQPVGRCCQGLVLLFCERPCCCLPQHPAQLPACLRRRCSARSLQGCRSSVQQQNHGWDKSLFPFSHLPLETRPVDGSKVSDGTEMDPKWLSLAAASQQELQIVTDMLTGVLRCVSLHTHPIRNPCPPGVCVYSTG